MIYLFKNRNSFFLWIWEKEYEEAYRLLINNITTAPALAQSILGQSFTVYTDGSTQAIGGVLTQIIEGKEHIEYWFNS